MAAMTGDTNSGEFAVHNLQTAFIKEIEESNGVINENALDRIFGQVSTYHQGSGISDGVYAVQISTYQIRNAQWGRAKVLIFGALDAAMFAYKPMETFDTLLARAESQGVNWAKIIIMNGKKQLEKAFGDNKLAHRQGTTQGLNLLFTTQMGLLSAKNPALKQDVFFNYEAAYTGFVASYQTIEKYGRMAVVLAEDSNRSKINQNYAELNARYELLNGRVEELFQKIEDLLVDKI